MAAVLAQPLSRQIVSKDDKFKTKFSQITTTAPLQDCHQAAAKGVQKMAEKWAETTASICGRIENLKFVTVDMFGLKAKTEMLFADLRPPPKERLLYLALSIVRSIASL